MALIKRCCCFTLKGGTFASALWVSITGFFALFFVVLDQAASDSQTFEISGSFVTDWRILIWKQWLACNVVMIFCHILLVALSVTVCVAHKTWVIYQQIPVLKAWCWLMVMYIIVEYCIAVYQFSWYGKNTFRVLSMPWLSFTFFFWILRTVMNLICLLTTFSRVQDIKYDLEYGDKKEDQTASFVDTTYPSAYGVPYNYEGYEYGDYSYGQYATDPQGYAVDPQGYAVDAQGYAAEGHGYPAYDQGGYPVDEKGNVVDGYGQKLDQYGYPIDDGRMYLDEQGKHQADSSV